LGAKISEGFISKIFLVFIFSMHENSRDDGAS